MADLDERRDDGESSRGDHVSRSLRPASSRDAALDWSSRRRLELLHHADRRDLDVGETCRAPAVLLGSMDVRDRRIRRESRRGSRSRRIGRSSLVYGSEARLEGRLNQGGDGSLSPATLERGIL